MDTFFKSEGFKNAKKLIEDGVASCVVINGSQIIIENGRGVSSLIKIYENSPNILKGGIVLDKIIGKAAAIIIKLGGAKAAYGLIMSAAGKDYLKENDLPFLCGGSVEKILNNKGDDYCPIEKSVLSTDDAELGYNNIKTVLASFKKHT